MQTVQKSKELSDSKSSLLYRDDDDYDVSSTESLGGRPYEVPSKSSRVRRMILPILLVLSLALNGALLLTREASIRTESSSVQCEATLFSSPIERDIERNTHTVPFNGSFFHRTIYREDPSPEVDEAWNALGAEDAWFPLSYEDGEAFGLRQNYHARLAPEAGQGFVAAAEAVHQLHCVNMLRKTVFFNYEYYRDRGMMPFKDADEVIKAHTTHCLDILRQQLICQPNLNVFGQVWVDLEDHGKKGAFPFPDFNTEQKCRNWEGVMDWINKRKYPDRVWLKHYDSDFTYKEMP